MHECVQFIHQLFISFSVMLLISVRLFFIFQSFLECAAERCVVILEQLNLIM
jgi:hypothetical protein